MKIKPVHIFVGLSISFLLYSLAIYTQSGAYEKVTKEQKNKIAAGRLVWQKYNCQSCHQFYGLGGYLGPDLTNEYSKLKGNEQIMKALFKGGIKQMPTFKLTSKEEEVLIDFLKATDASGNADPRNYKLLNDGMIEQKKSVK